MEMQDLELLWGKKPAELCEEIFSFSRRHSKFFPKGLARELGPFFSSCNPSIFDRHDQKTLRSILFSHYRTLIEGRKKPSQRIHTKIINLDPSTCGIVIGLTRLKEQELFSERHIQKGVQNLIPGIKPVPLSYFERTSKELHLFYLEVKKVRGGVFTKKELAKLKFDLPFELLQRIELVSQSLFLPGNEEELFKNIRHLSGELRYFNDLPQVMISFVEYINETLKFLVICLRVVKPNTPPIASISLQLPSLVRFSLENLFCVEKLRKKYPKEAAIFTLEVNSSLFLRNRNSVNLRAARQYISKALENMLGPFRDYNGGLLNQENRQLLEIKRSLEKKGLFFHGIEDFFYAIKPVSLRATFSTQVGCQFVAMIQKMSACPLPEGKKYHLEFQVAQKAHLVVIQTSEKKWKTSLPKEILATSSQIGFTFSEDDHYQYLCFFHQSPVDTSMLNAIQKELTQSSSAILDRQRAVLRMNFQGGEPPSLNPRFAADIHSNIIATFLFEGLMHFTSAGEVELAIAEKVEISKCKTEYLFRLRPSWWSCGEEVTAYDFERAWKRALMAQNAACIKPEFFYPIKNAKRAREKKCLLGDVGIETLDAYNLKVNLESPCPYFLNLLATPSFFPLYGEDEEPTVFNGPFIVAEWKPEERLMLSQNPFYWDARSVKLSGISISMVRNPYLAYDLFMKGQLDLIGDPISPLPPKMLEFIEIQKDLVEKPISRVFWIHCNTLSSPLSNPNLRLALSLAINRKRLVEKVFIHQIPHASPLPIRYSRSEASVEGDAALAKEYFMKAKMEMGEIPPLQMIHSDLSFEKPLAKELKKQWEEVLGVQVQTRALRWSEFSSALENGDFHLGGLFRRDLFNNPMFYLKFFKKSPGNVHSWENEQYETLLNGLENGEDKIQEIEQLLIEKTPVIPLVNQKNLMLINDRVKGLEWNQDGCINVKKVRIFHETGSKNTDSSDCLHRVSSE